MNAAESASHIQMLCLDKTGTLTTNQLRLHALAPIRIAEDEVRERLGDFVASASARNQTTAAIASACPGKRCQFRDEVPFSSERKWSGLTFDDPGVSGSYVLGAPEILKPSLQPRDGWDAQAEAWMAAGLRVLVFAHHSEANALHGGDGQPCIPSGLIPLALISLSDELRPEARETVAGFAKSGIGLKIIAGDSPKTVAALATQACLPVNGSPISGPELDALGKEQAAS